MRKRLPFLIILILIIAAFTAWFFLFKKTINPDTISRAWFNANQESKYYFVPSLIAVMLFIFSLLLTSIGIVKEKEIGTIEQVMVTPIRKIEFILGKTIPTFFLKL
ncbi:MAG: ABC transporter permease [Desulfobacula sp.]|jgi:ABC-type Na+ efflux pump permease subunit|nr:ABC transporter permease [Desulfobacula sp.]